MTAPMTTRPLVIKGELTDEDCAWLNDQLELAEAPARFINRPPRPPAQLFGFVEPSNIEFINCTWASS